MHNLDRTMFEAGQQESAGMNELEQEDFLGILGSLLKGETETGNYESEQAGELEAAAALLEVRDEAELDRFIGSLFNKAVGAAKNFAASPTGKALGGIVKKATKKALPVVGRGIGGWISPDYADTGARVGKAVGDIFGLELEGLSGEDREFEVAKALVRFAQSACRNAAKAPPGASPAEVARKAAVEAARQHAPGLLATTATNSSAPAGKASSGRWIRQGNAILILEN